MFKIGDKVLFSTGDEKLKDNIGIILDTNDTKFVIVNRSFHTNSIYYAIEQNLIDSIANVENIRNDIQNYYTIKINELKTKLKTATSEEKLQERIDKYNNTKYRIIKNCERIVVCTDDDEFENRIKEINKLKNELFNIDLECGDVIRKENGKVKYDIKKLEMQKNNSLSKISDENITKAFSYK